MTSYSTESKINDVNEDPLPAIDFSNDDDNNNTTNEVNSLEKAKEHKEQKEVDDDCANGAFVEDDSSEASYDQSRDFRDENFDDDANDASNIQKCSGDNIVCQAHTSCINNNTCHPDDEVNENVTMVMLSPNQLLTDKKPTLGSVKKCFKNLMNLINM